MNDVVMTEDRLALHASVSVFWFNEFHWLDCREHWKLSLLCTIQLLQNPACHSKSTASIASCLVAILLSLVGRWLLKLL